MSKPSPNLLDVVIQVTGGSLDFLEKWRSVFLPYHIIIVQSCPGVLKPPVGFNVKVLTVADAQQVLGPKVSCLSSGGSLSRSFGYMMSKKKYIYTIDENCLVATDPTGKAVDALQQHLVNLTSPSTPYFFNTLYDPYRTGADFVRGYPFSMREGTTTAVSHGLWLNRPDYDTATSLVKPRERNIRYVDAVLTVPKGVMYPMSNLNLAFDREMIGPAMFYSLSTAEQSADDMWAGWCAKVICDHLGHGHKTGLPYVWSSDKPTAVGSMERDSKALMWQEELIPFFSQVQLSPASNTAELAYLELAGQVRKHLGPKDAYFMKLSEAMGTWIQCWQSTTSA